MKTNFFLDISIKKKLIFICQFTAGLSLLLSGIVIVIAESFTFKRAYINEHIVQAKMIGYTCSAALLFNDTVAARDVLRALKNNTKVVYAAVYSKNGGMLADYHRDNVERTRIVHTPKEKGYRFGINYFTLYQSILFENDDIGTIFIESDLAQLYKTLIRHIAISALIIFGAFLIALLLISKLQRMITGPIGNLVGLMHNISKNKNYSLGADIKSKDELGLLAEGFNEMLSQIRNRDIELEQHGKFLENLVNQRTFEISQINEQLKTELTEHQQTGKALRELEQKYYNLFDNLNDAAFLTEVETGNITETNKQGEVLLGMTRDEIVGMKRWTLCRPEDGEELKKMFLQRENSFQGPDILNVRTVICRNKSEAVPVEISSSFVQIGDKHILLELFRDVTEHIKVENQIRASLEEKEVLLKEIHHRVKNNMQIITSLINLQLENTKEAQTVEIFKNCVNRIKSMALIHEKLYQSKDLTRIDFADYVNKLIDYLFYTYHVNSDTVKFRVSIKDIFLRINTAIPCGLIISELVSNSLKYAFKDRKDNEIEIDFFREREILPTENNNRYTLIVKDNGAGLPVGIDIKNTKTLGLRLVHSLSIQLGGTIGLIRDKGTEFKITFTLHD